ncbi:MAG: twin-arginine translocation signal domain-containing protein [Pseudolabrys sp.]
MTQKDKGKFGRRDFLRALGAGAGLAATAAAPLATEAKANESDKKNNKTHYNPNSEDVKNYYRVNGY